MQRTTTEQRCVQSGTERTSQTGHSAASISLPFSLSPPNHNQNHVQRTPVMLNPVTGVLKSMMPITIASTCFVTPPMFIASGDVFLLAENETMLSANAPTPLTINAWISSWSCKRNAEETRTPDGKIQTRGWSANLFQTAKIANASVGRGNNPTPNNPTTDQQTNRPTDRRVGSTARSDGTARSDAGSAGDLPSHSTAPNFCRAHR